MKFFLDLIGFERGVSYGFEEYVNNLLNYILIHRNEIRANQIVLACRESQVSYFRNLVKDRAEIVSVTHNSLWDKLRAANRAIKRAGIGEDDVVLFPCNTMPLFAVQGKKLLVVHDLLFRHGKFCSKNIRFWKFRLLRYVSMPLSLKRADKIVAISNYAKSEIQKYYKTPADKIEVIYNYFDFGKFTSSIEPLTITNIPQDYYLSVCSSVKHKNHITFLKAFCRLAKEEKKVFYVIVGGFSAEAEDYYRGIEANIKMRIHRLSHLNNSDMRYLYENAKAFISTSLYEGLGMPVVEAMSLGCPVIISDLFVHREVSLGLGYYFSPTSDEELYKLMKELALDRKDYKDKIRETYSESNTSAKYLKVINRLYGGN